MEKYTGICCLGVTLLLGGCYEDKGNYDYKEINEMSLTFSPASEGSKADAYIFSLPQKDSLFFELSAQVTQTNFDNDRNLEYRWVIPGEDTADTVYSKSYTFKFPPKKPKSYTNVLFSIKDKTNDVEFYQKLLVKTITPFLRSWMILHGRKGDRRIGVLEYEADRMQLSRKITDVYEELKGIRRFQNADIIKYSSMYERDVTKGDRLYVLEQDSCTWIYPFSCDVKGNAQNMMPNGFRSKFARCVCTTPGIHFAITDTDGKLYHGSYGHFYRTIMSDDVKEYYADQVYVAGGRCMTIWDDHHKQFFYYDAGTNYYPYDGSKGDENSFSARITRFPEIENLDLSKLEMMWMGHGLTENSNSGASVVMKNSEDGTYTLLHIGYGKSEKDESKEYVGVEIVNLNNPDFNVNSVFSSTYAYQNQLFYTLGSEVYLYNVASGESDFLYSVGTGKKITKMAFRTENRSSFRPENFEKMLGIVVETADGKGEFHEVFLNEASDVIGTAAHTGFGPIVDFCFSYLEHAGYDIL